MTTEAGGNPPDVILLACDKPREGLPFPKGIRVGAGWHNKESDTISLTLDSFVKLEGRPYANIHLLLVKNDRKGKPNGKD